MKIKRFKLKDEISRDQLVDSGFTDVHNLLNDGTWLYKCYPIRSKKLEFEVSINISFQEDLRSWNDFDNVDVIDEAFGQAYTPFYEALYAEDYKLFPALKFIIKSYNEIMSNLPFLEEIGGNT